MQQPTRVPALKPPRQAPDARSTACIRIEEPGSRPYPVPSTMMMGRAVAEPAAPPTPVVAAEIEIRAAVVLTATMK